MKTKTKKRKKSEPVTLLCVTLTLDSVYYEAVKQYAKEHGVPVARLISGMVNHAGKWGIFTW